MNLRRTAAIARKETLHVLRDPRALGIGIALPMLLLLLFGYALTLDVDKVPLTVWDQSRTAESRELVSRFKSSRYFSVRATASGYAGITSAPGYAGITSAIDRREALMALIIPENFARVLRSPGARVQVLLDGSDPNTAQIALGYAETVVRGYSRDILVSRIQRQGMPAPRPPIELLPRVWFNADMESRVAIIPGLIAVIMMLIAALLTSLTVAREWETGTIEQLLSTPVRSSELILGKLAPYFAIGMLDMALSVVTGRFLFGVPLRGSLLVLCAMSAVFLAGGLGLGILISVLAKSQLLASQVAFVATFLPAFLLSGFMFDVGNMPRALQVITYVVPARYFIKLLRGLFLKGVGPSVLAAEGVFLLVFSLIVLTLAVRLFKKKME